ncbi:MAG: hypothetical protein RR204_04575 [Raoultibacter sp.]
MQIPVDIKAVMDEATNIEAARKTPVLVTIFIDESAPADLQAHVRSVFSSGAQNARVSIEYYPSMPVAPVASADMALIVAGLNENAGKLAASIREIGVPVMVVTTLPGLVREIARAQKTPLLEGDLIAPDYIAAAPAAYALPTVAGATTAVEPYPLGEEACATLNLKMGEWTLDACREKRLAMALAFPFVRKPLSLDAVNATAMQNAGVGLVLFIPGADMPVMTLNQAKMLLQIAAAYGQPLGVERVKELAAVVGGAFACRAVARQLVAFVPALGWAVKAAIGYTGTLAMGRAAIEYFEADGSIDHLAQAVARARDKVVAAADATRKQPTAKAAVAAAVSAAGSKVGGAAHSVAHTVAAQAKPFSAQVVQSAAEAGGVSAEEVTRSVAGTVREGISAHFKKGKQ